MASYNRPPACRQQLPDAWRTPDDPVAQLRRSADQLLLASCDATESSAVARAAELLFGYALTFVAADATTASSAAEACLAGLLAASPADDAMLVEIDLESASHRVLAMAGHGPGAALFERVRPAWWSELLRVSDLSAGIEVPGHDRRRAAAVLSPMLAAASVGSLRWTMREADGSRLFAVAMHARAQGRCWTPACRRMHEGMADLLAAAGHLIGKVSPPSTPAD